MKINKVFIILFFMLIMPSIIFCQTENNNKEVDIQIRHGIQINDSIPGYRILVSNWGSRELLSLDLIDTEGKRITFINDKQNVKSDEDGMLSIDIPYTYGDIKPGMCILFFSGKLGVHMINIEYPKLEPPTDEKPYWDIWFSNTEYLNN